VGGLRLVLSAAVGVAGIERVVMSGWYDQAEQCAMNDAALLDEAYEAQLRGDYGEVERLMGLRAELKAGE